MNSTTPVLKEVVLIGGGHAHAYVLKMCGMSPEGVRYTLISRDIESPYSGMLPGHCAGLYTREECHIDLVKLCSVAGVRMIHAEVCGINTKKKLIMCSDGRPPLRYDILSLDVGIAPKPLPNIGSLRECNITPVKPIDTFASRWDSIVARANLDRTGNFRVVVVGGGAGGTELCLAMHERLMSELSKNPNMNLEFTLLQRGSMLLPSHNKGVQKLIGEVLKRRQIRILLNSEVIDVEQHEEKDGRGVLVTANDMRVPFDEAVWCTDACGQEWISATGLETSSEGFVSVNPTLESVNTRDVFACGDIANVVGHPRPKAGVFAVRAGQPLAKNIRRRLLGLELVPWTPQMQFLGIIGTGYGNAIASRGPLALEGSYLWTLKEFIDRKWMAMYTKLPDREEFMRQMVENKRLADEDENDVHNEDDLTPEELALAIEPVYAPDAKALLEKATMRCGGCGAKVGSTVLSKALKKVSRWAAKQGLPSSRDRKDIITGIGDDAAVIVPPPTGHLLVQTVDFFRSFIDDPFIFGQISANHALSDCHAMNASPLTALAVCTLPYGTEAQTESALVQMLAGAQKVLSEAGCALVGGHTCEATDTSLGFSITGSALPADLLPKGPILPLTDVSSEAVALILTKPLGTGAILAANMRGVARGVWVQSAINSMLTTNARAAAVLKSFGCFACTDVTGFGLMGHLIEMMRFRLEEEHAKEEVVRSGSDSDDDDDEEDSKCSIMSNPKDSSLLNPHTTLYMKHVPMLDGAVECVNMGVVSSLQPENLRSARVVSDSSRCLEAFGSAYQLLFDPQTAGGLLATVPMHLGQSIVDALKTEGYANAAIIGHVGLKSMRMSEKSIAIQADIE